MAIVYENNGEPLKEGDIDGMALIVDEYDVLPTDWDIGKENPRREGYSGPDLTKIK